MSDERPLNLVWRRSMLDGVLETPFLRHALLARLARPTRWIAVEDDAPLPELDDVLVCSFGDCGEYLRALREHGRRNLGVLHLGDERGADDLRFYADADYVLRHYHRPGLPPAGGHCRAISWIPNGWACGVGPLDPALHLGFEARRHEIFFAGHAGRPETPLPARDAMLDALRDLGRPASVILTEGFGQGLGPVAYGGYLGDSKFALAPAGNAPETIRFYDALECGAIPVVVDDAWLHASAGAGALGPPPVAILNGWRDLASMDTGAFDETCRQAAVQWWRRLKTDSATRVADVVETAFA